VLGAIVVAQLYFLLLILAVVLGWAPAREAR
jgi:hypothetical protein